MREGGGGVLDEYGKNSKKVENNAKYVDQIRGVPALEVEPGVVLLSDQYGRPREQVIGRYHGGEHEAKYPYFVSPLSIPEYHRDHWIVDKFFAPGRGKEKAEAARLGLSASEA